MNKIIEELYDKIDAQDKIINEQALEIARLKSKSEILEENNKLLIQQKQQMYEDLDIAYDKIDKAIEYITTEQLYTNYQWGKSQYAKILKDLLEILKREDKEWKRVSDKELKELITNIKNYLQELKGSDK